VDITLDVIGPELHIHFLLCAVETTGNLLE